MQDIKKLKGGRFGDIKKFLKKIRESKKFLKKIRILNSLIVPKILKKGTLWDFLTFVLLQNIKKIERRTLWGHLKKFEKKSHKAEKKSHKAEKSHSAEKSQNLLLRNTCEKNSAYPRVRTRNLWVEKQASYH